MCMKRDSKYRGERNEIDKKGGKEAKDCISLKEETMEPIIQSEVSQKEKHQYSVLTHICGI